MTSSSLITQLIFDTTILSRSAGDLKATDGEK